MEFADEVQLCCEFFAADAACVPACCRVSSKVAFVLKYARQKLWRQTLFVMALLKLIGLRLCRFNNDIWLLSHRSRLLQNFSSSIGLLPNTVVSLCSTGKRVIEVSFKPRTFQILPPEPDPRRLVAI